VGADTDPHPARVPGSAVAVRDLGGLGDAVRHVRLAGRPLQGGEGRCSGEAGQAASPATALARRADHLDRHRRAQRRPGRPPHRWPPAAGARHRRSTAPGRRLRVHAPRPHRHQRRAVVRRGSRIHQRHLPRLPTSHRAHSDRHRHARTPGQDRRRAAEV
ncbi:MAG: FHA-domain-containing protein, partial [uncultured Nocardioidaceae bacterium]